MKELPDFCTHEENFNIASFAPRPEHEERFWAWAREVLSGHTQRILLIQGPPGSGKSWLSQYLQQQVTKKANVEGFYLNFSSRHPPDDSDRPTTQQHILLEILSTELSFLQRQGPHEGEIAAWLEQAVRDYIQREGVHGAFFFVDGLDRLAEDAVRVVREWLPGLAPADVPVGLAVVHYEHLPPALYWRGVERLYVGAWHRLPEQPGLEDVRRYYQEQWRLVTAEEPSYDFRYPLLNSWIRYCKDNDLGIANLWLGGLTCLFARRPATYHYASLNTGPSLSWGILLKGLLELEWEARENVYTIPHRRIRSFLRESEEAGEFLRHLEEAHILVYQGLIYAVDASLWKFLHDVSVIKGLPVSA